MHCRASAASPVQVAVSGLRMGREWALHPCTVQIAALESLDLLGTGADAPVFFRGTTNALALLQALMSCMGQAQRTAICSHRRSMHAASYTHRNLQPQQMSKVINTTPTSLSAAGLEVPTCSRRCPPQPAAPALSGQGEPAQLKLTGLGCSSSLTPG